MQKNGICSLGNGVPILLGNVNCRPMNLSSQNPFRFSTSQSDCRRSFPNPKGIDRRPTCRRRSQSFVWGQGTPRALALTLSSGTYTSAATALSGGSTPIYIPAGSLAVGSDTLTASYSGDSNYNTAIRLYGQLVENIGMVCLDPARFSACQEGIVGLRVATALHASPQPPLKKAIESGASDAWSLSPLKSPGSPVPIRPRPSLSLHVVVR